VARARELAEALEREVDLVLEKKNLYSIRIGEIDPQSGWCAIYCKVSDIAEPRLGVIFGDVMHNLRSALDYVVVALAQASGTVPARKHQFPILDNAVTYQRRVGPPGAPKKDGPLGGVRYGAQLVEELQPYNRYPDPFASPLWDIRCFSNADKHRQISALASLMAGCEIQISHGGRIMGRCHSFALPRACEQEQEIWRVQFAPPYPSASEICAEGETAFAILFTTPAFDKMRHSAGIDVQLLPTYCDYVAQAVECFEAL
jgi:hypothetical protein